MTAAKSGRWQQSLMYCVERKSKPRVRPLDRQCIEKVAAQPSPRRCPRSKACELCSQHIWWTPLPASLAPQAPKLSHSSCRGSHFGRTLRDSSLWRNGKAARCGVPGKICSTCRRCRPSLDASHSDDTCRLQWSWSFEVSSPATSTSFERADTRFAVSHSCQSLQHHC